MLYASCNKNLYNIISVPKLGDLQEIMKSIVVVKRHRTYLDGFTILTFDEELNYLLFKEDCFLFPWYQINKSPSSITAFA